MILYQEKHADLPNVGVSQLGSINIPCMYNHHGLLLNFISAVPAALTQAQIETDVAWISVTITKKDGGIIKLIDRMTPAEIFDLLNDYPEDALSVYANAGCLYLAWTRPGRLRAQNWSLALGMEDVSVYQLQV